MKTTSRRCSPACTPWTTPTSPDLASASALLRTPLLPKPLNQRLRLGGADCNEFGTHVAVFPFNNRRARCPRQIPLQCLINPTLRAHSATDEAGWILCRSARSNNGVILPLGCHVFCTFVL